MFSIEKSWFLINFKLEHIYPLKQLGVSECVCFFVSRLLRNFGEWFLLEYRWFQAKKPPDSANHSPDTKTIFSFFKCFWSDAINNHYPKNYGCAATVILTIAKAKLLRPKMDIEIFLPFNGHKQVLSHFQFIFVYKRIV